MFRLWSILKDLFIYFNRFSYLSISRLKSCLVILFFIFTSFFLSLLFSLFSFTFSFLFFHSFSFFLHFVFCLLLIYLSIFLCFRFLSCLFLFFFTNVQLFHYFFSFLSSFPIFASAWPFTQHPNVPGPRIPNQPPTCFAVPLHAFLCCSSDFLPYCLFLFVRSQNNVEIFSSHTYQI